MCFVRQKDPKMFLQYRNYRVPVVFFVAGPSTPVIQILLQINLIVILECIAVSIFVKGNCCIGV